jgi:hypothetical protein
MVFQDISEVGDRDLYILWTNADLDTSENMVFMYGGNGLKKGWWDKVTIIVWGATQKLVAENPGVLEKVHELMDIGVEFTACQACAQRYELVDFLRNEGVEVTFWGKPLTELLQSGKHVLTI